MTASPISTPFTSPLLAFLLSLDGLKAVERRTSPAGLTRRENSAEHSWHGALAALLLAGECAFTVDARHAALLFLMHDVPEIRCGDTFVYAAERDDALQREAVALGELLLPLPPSSADELRALWQEFSDNSTPAARYANAIDRILPLLHNLSHDGNVWRAHGVTHAQVMARNGFIAEVLPRLWAEVAPRVDAWFARNAT